MYTPLKYGAGQTPKIKSSFFLPFFNFRSLSFLKDDNEGYYYWR